MECGEFSPLSAGDLSPSQIADVIPSSASTDAAAEALGFSHPVRTLDGDKSPAESGDESTHSTAPGDSNTGREPGGRMRPNLTSNLAAALLPSSEGAI